MTDDKENLEDKGELDLSFEDVSGDNQEKIDKLKHRLKESLREKEENLSGWQRCRADFVNSKKAAEIERLGLADAVSESLVGELLPVIDSFDLAFSDKSQVEAIPESWRAGFLGIYSKMIEVLERKGLKQVGHVGDKFDIREQEPVATVDLDKEDLDDTVTEVLQKGYSFKDRIIRPAKVTIGQYKNNNK